MPPAEPQAPSSPCTWTMTTLSCRAASRANIVSLMPSGVVMLSRITTSRVVPATDSTTFPSQSVLMPYSNRSPGCEVMGALNASADPGTTLGMPVADSYFTRSSFQNQ